MDMAAKFQDQTVFHMTGKRSGDGLAALQDNYCPALLAPFRDLTQLRHDYPMAQAGGILVMPEDGSAKRKNFYLVSIGHAKFRRTVVPGDQMTLEVSVLQARGNFRRLASKAEVGGQTVAEAELTLTGVDPE